jgi:hypothetical protein
VKLAMEANKYDQRMDTKEEELYRINNNKM